MRLDPPQGLTQLAGPAAHKEILAQGGPRRGDTGGGACPRENGDPPNPQTTGHVFFLRGSFSKEHWFLFTSKKEGFKAYPFVDY